MARRPFWARLLVAALAVAGLAVAFWLWVTAPVWYPVSVEWAPLNEPSVPDDLTGWGVRLG